MPKNNPIAAINDTNEHGFTLIELLVVILVIGILAAVAIPVFLNQRKTANEAAVKSDLTNAAKVFETEFVTNKGKAYPTAIPESVKTSEGVTLTVFNGSTTPVEPIVNIPFTAQDGYTMTAQFRELGGLRGSIPATDMSRNLKFKYQYKCANGTSSPIREYGHTASTTGSSINLGTSCSGSTMTPGSIEIISDFTSAQIANTTQLIPVVGKYQLPNPNGPGTPVASNKGFCIDGTHENIGGKKFKYDSLNGGFQEGSCS